MKLKKKDLPLLCLKIHQIAILLTGLVLKYTVSSQGWIYTVKSFLNIFDFCKKNWSI